MSRCSAGAPTPKTNNFKNKTSKAHSPGSCCDEDGEEALSVCSIKAHAAFSLNMVTVRVRAMYLWYAHPRFFLAQRFLGRYEFKVGSAGAETYEQEIGSTLVLLAQVLCCCLLLLLLLLIGSRRFTGYQ